MEWWRVVLIVLLLCGLLVVTWRRQLAERRLAQWREEERQQRARYAGERLHLEMLAQMKRDLEEACGVPDPENRS